MNFKGFWGGLVVYFGMLEVKKVIMVLGYVEFGEECSFFYM